MDVHINEVVSTVRAARGDVSQGRLEDTVRAVLKALRAQHADEKQSKSDRRVSSGARDEQEGEN
jgi:hypothetical protein